MAGEPDNAAEQQAWYARYHERVGADRNDLRANPGVLWQTLAQEAAVVRALRRAEHDPAGVRVLDVGCGDGGSLFQLLRLGYQVGNVSGIDIQPDRLEAARAAFPSASFVLGDATRMPYATAAFGLVTEFTMFAGIESDGVRQALAGEMLRVCAPGGYLLLVDWWTPRPGTGGYRALTRADRKRLFGVGRECDIAAVVGGSLAPPVGRLLSARAAPLYGVVGAVLPFLVSLGVHLLRRRPPAGRDQTDGDGSLGSA